MKKRIFAGLLTLVMVFTLLPVSALAANEAFILDTTTLGDASLEKGTPQNYRNGHAINGVLHQKGPVSLAYGRDFRAIPSFIRTRRSITHL